MTLEWYNYRYRRRVVCKGVNRIILWDRYQLTIISYYYFDTTEIKVSEIQTSYILCPWPGVTNGFLKNPFLTSTPETVMISCRFKLMNQ